MGALFDFSFDKFLTAKLLRFLYGLGLVSAAIGAIMFGFGQMDDGFFSKIVGLILIPIAFVVLAVLVRIWTELIMVVFRIAENTRETADAVKRAKADPAVF